MQKRNHTDELHYNDNAIEINSKKKPKFVLSTIMYADGEEANYSSDEEYNTEDEVEFSKLDTTNLNSPDSFAKLPYRPFEFKKDRDGKIKDRLKIEKKQKFAAIPQEKLHAHTEGTKVKPFLDKLLDTGLEQRSSESMQELVSTSILLNRPLSLSTRKNNLLINELSTNTDNHKITHRKFGIFWNFQWYDQNHKPVQSRDENAEIIEDRGHKTVKSFYKKLKSYDKKHDTSKAKEFREACEKMVAVPYQELRELAKNNESTESLVRIARDKNPDSDVYLSIVDGDTISFNGIYTAYLKIHYESNIPPTVMSTGYEFKNLKRGDYPFVKCAEFSRSIQVATAKHFPYGTYYPEPNLCILILPNLDTVKESFIDPTRGGGFSLESPILLSNILKTRGKNTIWIFGDDNPLITEIPVRFYKTTNRKGYIKFSEEFQYYKAMPTIQDIQQFNQVGQSKTNPREFAASLYYNKGFKLTGNNKELNAVVQKLLECNKQEAVFFRNGRENDCPKQFT